MRKGENSLKKQFYHLAVSLPCLKPFSDFSLLLRKASLSLSPPSTELGGPKGSELTLPLCPWVKDGVKCPVRFFSPLFMEL